ncbi:MAG: hypothetical protein ACI9UN_005080 [Granulosicoccus sp.]|jgi:hypothetical protein
MSNLTPFGKTVAWTLLHGHMVTVNEIPVHVVCIEAPSIFMGCRKQLSGVTDLRMELIQYLANTFVFVFD